MGKSSRARPWIEYGCALGFALVLMVIAAGTLLAPASRAQTFRGTVVCTVTDASGAAIPGAKVTVRNVATGLERDTLTSDDGSYAVPELPIGTYDVTIAKTGFQTAVTNGVQVAVAAQKTVDAILTPGAVTQRVVVSATTLRQVDTTTPPMCWAESLARQRSQIFR